MPENAAPTTRKLSEELTELAARFSERAITLRDVILQLRERAYSLLLILLALPFLTPIPLPGLSTPFGLAIAFIALRMALGKRPWLPKNLQRRQLPAGFFVEVLRVSARILRFLEALLKPRWSAFVDPEGLRRLHACLILVSACVLLLPLPIPFSNTFPAWAVVLVAAGMLERDGLMVGLGWCVFLGGVAYFVFLGEAAQKLAEMAWRWLQS